MNKASLLVELGTEELPPKSLKTLKDALGTLLSKALLDRQFEHVLRQTSLRRKLQTEG